MYPVSANFHTLAVQDAPKTRVRIYFIDDTVDCTDDNDVTTNGTLLVGAVGDTDSNGRIGQDGIKFTEYDNPEYNVTIGRAVSSQVEMTLLNTDGALDNFGYGRCKIYIDVYDSANSTWLSCPMGVYIIDLPTRRKSQLIHAFGYDQMQKLDGICDTWWGGLNFSGGLTLLQIVNSMASQTGVSVSTATATAIVNSSVTYTSAPFDCVETTYREVLELIAEVTGTVARFDRDGALDLKWFKAAQIGGNTVEIDTDTIGNQCLSIDLAEYQVAAIDLLKVKIAEDDVGVTVGSGTNQYTILDNLFLDGSVATITTRATAIYNRLNALGAYKPIQSKLIWDWSIEAGDIIDITRDGTTYTTPIFQQTMTWRGGYVVSNLVNSGDNVRPVPAYNERSTYRMQSEMSAKVGDNEIISKINQTSEQITIQANRLNLLGYTTINNGFVVNLDGTFEANGATINGKVVSDGAYDDVIVDDGLITFKDANDTTIAYLGDNGLGYAELSFIRPNARSYVWSSGFNIKDANNNNKVNITGASADFNVPVSATGLTINGNAIKAIIAATHTKTASTVTSGSQGSCNISIGLSGYTPLGIISVEGADNSNLCLVQFSLFDSSTARLVYVNTGTVSRTPSWTVTILYLIN